MSSSLSYLSRPYGTVPSASHSWRSWCSRFRWPEVSLEDVVVGLGCVCLNVVVFCGVRRRELPRASPSLVSKPWVRNFFSVKLPKSRSRRMGSPRTSIELTGNLPEAKELSRAAERVNLPKVQRKDTVLERCTPISPAKAMSSSWAHFSLMACSNGKRSEERVEAKAPG